MEKNIFLIIILSLILLNDALAQQVPVIENRSLVIAEVQGIILKDPELPELILKILESKSIEGYRNMAKVGEIVLVVPFRYMESKDLGLLLSLKPKDRIEGELEFVGDEYERKWIIRRVKKYIEESYIYEMVKNFLILKRFIKKEEDLSYTLEELEDGFKLTINTKEKVLNLIMNKDLIIIDYF